MHEASSEEIERVRNRLPFLKFKRVGGMFLSGTVFVRDLQFIKAEVIMADVSLGAGKLKIL
jgi:hypothetical protein